MSARQRFLTLVVLVVVPGVTAAQPPSGAPARLLPELLPRDREIDAAPSTGAGRGPQGREERAAFITRLGTDTLVIERVTRTATRIEGDLLAVSPQVRFGHYVADLAADGRIVRFEYVLRVAVAAPDAPPVLERRSVIADSVITTEVLRSGVRDTAASGRLIARRGAVPWVQGGTAFLDQVVRQARAGSGDSVVVDQFTFGAQGVFPSRVVRERADTVALTLGPPGGAPFLVKVDKEGRLAGLDARKTTVRVRIDRIPYLDLEPLGRRFAAAEKEAGKIAGLPSPRDTVESTIAGASIWVDYGRPMRRGRTIFGALVPRDSIWRTGANAATQLRTSGDLRIGGAVVPAGLYTVWTLPTRNGPKLIINKQTGQWGTQYDPSQDLVRVDMRELPLPSPVEQFTIRVVPNGSGGELRLEWDRSAFVVPIEAKG